MAIEFLVKAREIESEAKSILRAKIRSMELAEMSFSSVEERVSGGDKEGVIRRFSTYADLSKMLDLKLSELYSTQMTLLGVIGKVESAKHRTLLTERYINCETWEITAERMGYSVRQIMRLHDEAVLSTQRVLESENIKTWH